MTVTFFGHRDASDSVEPRLRKAILEQIQRGATLFYVGNHGGFDRMVAAVLQKICRENEKLRYRVVLAYLSAREEDHPTVYPEGLESVPLRFAIERRNRWMISQADTVIVYAPYVGNSRKWKEEALKKGKTVIDLSDNGV